MKTPTCLSLLLALVSAVVFAPAAQAFTAEHWLGLPLNPSVITLQRDGISKRAPNSSTTLTSASISSLAAGTGVRLRGTVTPSVAGDYIFAIAGANNFAIWLSPNDSRFQKRLIAWHYESTTALQWTKFSSQQSAPVALAANTAYYIEAQVVSTTSGGHLSLGWKAPGSTTIQPIPGTLLAAVVADSADTNDNNLPDSWESQTGLASSTIPSALAESGDPDNDGIVNFEEYLLSSNPLAKEARSNGITRDTWSEIQGQSTTHLTAARARFLSYPSALAHVPGIDESYPNKVEGKNYGARYRGFIVAPSTGTYRFWIAGDDDAEFWFADGTVRYPGTSTPLTNRFGKQLLAHTHNPGGSYYTNYRDFDLLPSQRSRSLQLTAGQTYYIEVLHKNEAIATNHVSLAWETPGQGRTIVPASAFQSDIPEDGDRDSDSLPDAWEIDNLLNPTDNGYTSALQGEYGDFDKDGLNNLLEFQLGTNPKAADTDSDGLSDATEINYHHTNPLIPNWIVTTLLGTINLSSPSATSVPWQVRADGSILARDRRGWTDWQFTVPLDQQGIQEIRITGGAEGGAVRTKENLPISFQINGELLGRQTMACVIGQNTTIKQLTPWLAAGIHTLRIENHNVRADCKLRINSITIQRLGGTDSDSDGIADWAETKFQNENQLTRIPSESLTSPAFIEGVVSSFVSLQLTRSLPGLDSEIQTALPGVDHGFYANVPLDPLQAVSLTVSFQNGTPPTIHPIAWAPTNIFEHGSLAIRQGDSLRFTAHPPTASPVGTFTLQSSVVAPPTSGETQPVDQPVILTFDTPGTHTLTATWTPPEGLPQSAVLTVTVASATFGPAFVVETYNRRTWNIAGVQGMAVEADATLFWNETTGYNASPRSFLVNAYNAGSYRAIARVPATGEIIAAGEINAFSLTRANATADAQIVQIRADGSRVIRFTIVAENLPPNAEIRLHLNYQGSTFSDGGRDLILHPSDFSTRGVAYIYVETSSNPPQLCHSMSAFLLD